MRDFLKQIEKGVLIHDGSKGYLLQTLGLKGGDCGELWNLTNQDAVRRVYRAYLEAGSDVIQTNTFPGNRIHLSKYGIGDKTYEINYLGAKLAKEVAGDRAFVSGAIGPTGVLFEPSGQLSFRKAYEIYCEQVKALADGGVDVINFETFTDLAELRAAYWAARDVTSLPVICSLAFENNGHTLMGTNPFVAVAVLRSVGVDMVGANCSFGPEHMADIIKAMHDAGGGYLSVKPNAGLPVVTEGMVSYKETPVHFAELAAKFVGLGARLIGGCCGTTPEFIKVLKERVLDIIPAPAADRPKGIITSNTKYVSVDKLDKENIYKLDAKSNAEMMDALKNNDLSWVEDTGLDMASEGFDAIYVNTDAIATTVRILSDVVDKLQWYVRDPIIIETNSVAALEEALRIYRGIAGVIIKEDTADKVALAAVADKYGGVVVSID
jgi:5-methyltetrahydrofolate--homocysteine methyltransferase